jgi:GDPmannose 4,6-dehydratase
MLMPREIVGYAPDYVEAMWRILQHTSPDDFVVATGESHSVREFVNLAFNHASIELEWKGNGVDEKGIVRSFASNLQPLTSNLAVGDVVIEIDSRYFRPTEVDFLLGDASKARRVLGWESSIKFSELVKIMVQADAQDLMNLRRCQDVIQRITNNKETSNIGSKQLAVGSKL